MIKKLAIWYLRKTKVSVIINCHFNKRLDIGMADTTYCYGSTFVEGTTFKHENGNDFILRKGN